MINKIIDDYLKNLQEQKVIIPMKHVLGLRLDDPLDSYKKLISSGKKTFEIVSQQLKALYVLNKNDDPNIALEAKRKRESLVKWIENEREKNPEFGK